MPSGGVLGGFVQSFGSVNSRFPSRSDHPKLVSCSRNADFLKAILSPSAIQRRPWSSTSNFHGFLSPRERIVLVGSRGVVNRGDGPVSVVEVLDGPEG